MKLARSSVQRDYSDARLAQEVLHFERMLRHLAARSCNEEKERRRMELRVLQHFPRTA